jgi:hypothetical protein
MPFQSFTRAGLTTGARYSGVASSVITLRAQVLLKSSHQQHHDQNDQDHAAYAKSTSRTICIISAAAPEQ